MTHADAALVLAGLVADSAEALIPLDEAEMQALAVAIGVLTRDAAPTPCEAAYWPLGRVAHHCCTLPYGHDGPHRNDDAGMEWPNPKPRRRPTRSVEPVARCESVGGAGRCIRPSGHDGAHEVMADNDGSIVVWHDARDGRPGAVAATVGEPAPPTCVRPSFSRYRC